MKKYWVPIIGVAALVLTFVGGNDIYHNLRIGELNARRDKIAQSRREINYDDSGIGEVLEKEYTRAIDTLARQIGEHQDSRWIDPQRIQELLYRPPRPSGIKGGIEIETNEWRMIM